MDIGTTVIRQHLIDPVICIRCNTCEATCPVGAITHDERNYVVDVTKCNLCMACVPPCPTGSIDNWREVPQGRAYGLDEQWRWDELPPEHAAFDRERGASGGSSGQAATPSADAGSVPDAGAQADTPAVPPGAVIPPWSAAHPYVNLYGPRAAQAAARARVSGNLRVTEAGRDNDTHHIVLDFGTLPFPVLEGQSVGILPPGVDRQGRPHHARQYSVASPRDGERPGYNNLSLTVKRVLSDHDGRPVRGVASNYLCDLAVGDEVDVVGPFGTAFLMPNHPGSRIVMICTGTGSAPMRAMTEWRRRMRSRGKPFAGRLALFFGARTQEELPYFGPLRQLPSDFIDIHLAFSRTPGQPRRYVQDRMREQAVELLSCLRDPECYFYVCGLRAMEEGVLAALQEIARDGGLDWSELARDLRRRGRLHLETY